MKILFKRGTSAASLTTYNAGEPIFVNSSTNPKLYIGKVDTTTGSLANSAVGVAMDWHNHDTAYDAIGTANAVIAAHNTQYHKNLTVSKDATNFINFNGQVGKTITLGDGLNATLSGDTLAVDHKALGTGSALSGTSATPGDSINAVVGIAADSYGHISGMTYNTLTFSSAPSASNPIITKSDFSGAVIFKGTLGSTGATRTTLPLPASAGNLGWAYKVITEGDYAIDQATPPTTKHAIEGDMFICADLGAAGSPSYSWVHIPSGDEPSGTVTSVAMTVPNGLTVTGSPITTSGTLAVTLTSGYEIPLTSNLYGFAKVTVGSATAEASTYLDTLTVTGDTWIVPAVTAASKTLAFTHKAATAYSAKGSATKVAQITTDAAGHVTVITEVDIDGTSLTHTHGNINMAGEMTDTAAAATTGDYLLIRDASNNKVQTSTIDGAAVATAVTNSHTHSNKSLLDNYAAAGNSSTPVYVSATGVPTVIDTIDGGSF